MGLKESFEDRGHKPVPIKMFLHCILQTGPVHGSTKSAVGDERLCPLVQHPVSKSSQAGCSRGREQNNGSTQTWDNPASFMQPSKKDQFISSKPRLNVL